MPAGIIPDADVPGQLDPFFVFSAQNRTTAVFGPFVVNMVVSMVIIGKEIFGVKIPMIIFAFAKKLFIKKPVHIGKQIKAVGPRFRLTAKKHDGLVFIPQFFCRAQFIRSKVPGLPALKTALHKQYFVFIPVKAIVKRLGKMEKAAELPVKERLHGMKKGYALVADKDGDHFLNSFLILERRPITSVETGGLK
jgi:hypothetical protein